MGNPFKTVRWSAYAFCCVCAAAVLGIAAHQATLWLHQPFHRPYIIFALVVTCLTIFVLLLVSLRSQPRIDILVISILAILWLALASYSTDRIGHLTCELMNDEWKPTDGGGQVRAIVWCREMKAIMAFSWANFGVLLLSLVGLLGLATKVAASGNKNVWSSSVSDLHFGHQGDQPRYVYPATTGGTYGGGNVVYQQPGHNVIIDGNTVRQVPTGSVY